MVRRKTAAGGYEDSSDGSDIEIVDNSEHTLKRSKSIPHVLPRLTAGAFQFPGSRSSSGRSPVPSRHVSLSSSNRPTATPEGIQTLPKTPEILVCESVFEMSLR